MIIVAILNMSSANAFNLDQSKNLSLGKGLNKKKPTTRV